MKFMIALRGISGIGKSTWIKNEGLEPYCFSRDKIRDLFGVPQVDLEGYFQRNNKYEKKVIDFMNERIKEKMETGSLIILDETNIDTKRLNYYYDLCKKNKYTFFVKEFEANLPLALKQNQLREGIDKLDESIIVEQYEKLKSTPLSKKFNKFTFFHELFKEKEIEKYKVIGDIHGCYDVLKEAIIDNFKEDTTYIFTGDYFDRGIQNVEVFNWLYSIMNLPNVVLIEGNHDTHLKSYYDCNYEIKESFKKTKEEFELAGITKSQVKEFYSKLKDCYIIQELNRIVIINHGGLNHFPESKKNLIKIDSKQFIKGIGGYDYDVDNKYTYNMNSLIHNSFQIHGHRSLFDSEKSISLESSVEFGGELKVYCSVTKKVKGYKNNVYNKNLNSEIVINTLKTESQEINKLASYSRFIKVKKLDNGLASINFNKFAFKEKVWNQLTVKSRGLFVDQKTGIVVARSYDKFFNQEELTTLNNIKFPLYCYDKPCGFLGIISVYKNELLFLTKSTNKSEQAGWFKNYFESIVDSKTRKLLKEELLKNNDSIVFEVIIPEYDFEHPVLNESNRIILLDSFANDLKTIKSKNLDEYKKILINTEIENKELIKIFNSLEEFNNSEIFNQINFEKEGFVLEDSNGFMFKKKLKNYLELKRLRSFCKKISLTEKEITIYLNKTDSFKDVFDLQVCVDSFIKHRGIKNEFYSNKIIKDILKKKEEETNG